MKDPEIIIKRVFDAEVSIVWRAITEKELMKLWYFDLKEFKPEVGFKFDFLGGTPDGIQYNHRCEIIEAEFEKKLVYSWRYENYEGISYVSFELTALGDKTQLDFSHSGLVSFPESNPDFALQNFNDGWNHIINTSLKEFLETKL